jgi:hypothetical protein
MQEITSFDISHNEPGTFTTGNIGIVLANDVTMLAVFNHQALAAGHKYYYFTVIYSNNPQKYVKDSEVQIIDTQFKNFFPVTGNVRILQQGNNLFMVTEKQSYPL